MDARHLLFSIAIAFLSLRLKRAYYSFFLLRAAHVGLHQDASYYLRGHHLSDDARTPCSNKVFKKNQKAKKTKWAETQEDDNTQITPHETLQSPKQLLQDAFDGCSTKKVA